MPVINGVRVTKSQAEVHAVLAALPGVALPDHALVPLAQHAMGSRQSSSGIRSRRCELLSKRLVTHVGTVRTGSGRQAKTYAAA